MLMDLKLSEDQLPDDKEIKVDKFVTQKRKRYRPSDIHESLRKKRKITWDLDEWVKSEMPQVAHSNHLISSLKLIQKCKSHVISYMNAEQTQLVRMCTWYDSYENEYFIVVMHFLMVHKIWKSSDHGFQFVKKKSELPADVEEKIGPLIIMEDNWTWTLRNTETYATLNYSLQKWREISVKK